jgi:RNA polymerase sigma-70 factor (ECF subfamily)
MTQTRQPSGGSERLAQWVRDHARPVRGYLLALVRSPDVADDLLQEVFRRAWQGQDRYCEQGTPRAYLLKIADRLACDWGRKARLEVQLDDEAWQQIEPSAGQLEPAEELDLDEARRELAAALESISPPQRRVLLLRYYGNLGFQEIAGIMNCPLGTVLSHCRRGLLAMRKLLAEK